MIRSTVSFKAAATPRLANLVAISGRAGIQLRHMHKSSATLFQVGDAAESHDIVAPLLDAIRDSNVIDVYDRADIEPAEGANVSYAVDSRPADQSSMIEN